VSVSISLKSVMHGQCNARPTSAVTFPLPVIEHHRRLSSTELYCLVTWHMCERVA